MAALDEALEGMSRRQLEELQGRIARQLEGCALDGREGAEHYLITGRHARASIRLCRPCFERLRLPPGRAADVGT